MPHRPLPPRVLALAVFTLGVVGLGINEWMSEARNEVYLIAVLACPTMALLGAAGLVDPRMLWSLGPRRKEYPLGVRVAGVLVLIVGLCGAVGLGLFRYPLFPI